MLGSSIRHVSTGHRLGRAWPDSPCATPVPASHREGVGGKHCSYLTIDPRPSVLSIGSVTLACQHHTLGQCRASQSTCAQAATRLQALSVPDIAQRVPKQLCKSRAWRSRSIGRYGVLYQDYAKPYSLEHSIGPASA
eukprot:3370079-Rhodomonas_salina.8